ncbi:hypothetical protein ESA94_20365 [Lacibacter luteus]|uniref:Uncharacterized protein n=1 Tax=Lacibacter luteus TaxID=2508719 RepID=A0A4Q1CDD3_9BACT|nr:hypothetical protein [Lacibacter luteus]RXK57555.1 hypothetical protein ESA94_20365 [Lacibacter luteus]
MAEQEFLSFEATFFERLVAYLKEQVPELQYLNWDLGQLENYEISPPVAWPCALIDIDDTNFTDQLQLVQEANTVVMIRIGFNPFSNTSNLQPAAVRAKGNYYWELEQKVYKALQGWDADGLCSPLTRIRKVKERREEDSFRVRVLLFATRYDDDSAMKESYKLQVPMELDAEIDID